jgi:hypothetical protein
MFRRLIFEDWVMIFPLVAFITASTIYVTITWRALRMKRPQIDRMAQLPFNSDETSPRA